MAELLASPEVRQFLIFVLVCCVAVAVLRFVRNK